MCGKDVRDLKGVSICAIGPKTKEALEKYALRVDYVPCEYRAEQIFEGLKDKLKPEDKVLLPRADIARKALPKALSKIGVQADEVVVYKTVPVAQDADKLVEMLKQGEIHILTFTSSSTVKNFVNLLRAQNLSEILENVTVASIGPVTSATAKELGINVDVEAKEYTIDGLVEAMIGK
jgi:uroporphyrinogen III methyltransferase/synthase